MRRPPGGASFGARALCAGAVAAAAAQGSATTASCAADLVEVQAQGRVATFRVDIADNAEEHARGLMFRTDLPADAGMLFLFETAQERAFWMRDTPLPLDMLFIAPDGRVCGIVANARPFDETPRWSGCAASAVLEINGGLAARLGIGVGAAVRHPAFGPDAAAPCG